MISWYQRTTTIWLTRTTFCSCSRSITTTTASRTAARNWTLNRNFCISTSQTTSRRKSLTFWNPLTGSARLTFQYKTKTTRSRLRQTVTCGSKPSLTTETWIKMRWPSRWKTRSSASKSADGLWKANSTWRAPWTSLARTTSSPRCWCWKSLKRRKF